MDLSRCGTAFQSQPKSDSLGRGTPPGVVRLELAVARFSPGLGPPGEAVVLPPVVDRGNCRALLGGWQAREA